MESIKLSNDNKLITVTSEAFEELEQWANKGRQGKIILYKREKRPFYDGYWKYEEEDEIRMEFESIISVLPQLQEIVAENGKIETKLKTLSAKISADRYEAKQDREKIEEETKSMAQERESHQVQAKLLKRKIGILISIIAGITLGLIIKSLF